MDYSTHTLTIVLLTALLSACGGGSSSSTEDNTRAISQAEATNFIEQDGTWRYELIANITLSGNDAASNISYDYSNSINGIFVGVLGNIGTSSQLVDICDEDGFRDSDQPFTIFDETTGVPSLLILEDNDIPGGLSCELSTRFTQLSDSSIVAEGFCDTESLGSLVITKLSNDLTLDFGSLDFTASSGMFGSINNASNICGSKASSDRESSFIPQPNSLDFEDEEVSFSQIIVRAPHTNTDEFLTIEMSFFNITPEVRSYIVSDIALNPSQGGSPGSPATNTFTNGVLIEFLSPEFPGGTLDDPGKIGVTSGTLTISSITQDSVSGSYDLLMETGDTFTGNFAIDLNDNS